MICMDDNRISLRMLEVKILNKQPLARPSNKWGDQMKIYKVE